MIGIRFFPLTSADVRVAGTRDEPLRTSAWEAIRTDDGPNLASKEMENNLEEIGVVHHHTTPHLCDPGPMAKLSVKISHS